MKILVTGKNGQLGRSIQKFISNFNYHEFILVGREELDLSSSKSISKYFEIDSHYDVIINCAAYTAVDRAEDEIDLADEINHQVVKKLAEFTNKQNVKLIHISTDYVFDGKNQSLYLESDHPNPINVYGKSKLLGEKAIIETMPNNAMIIRTSWVYSEFGNNFVKTMLKLGSENNEINVVSDQLGSPTYASDLAEAILHIISNDNFSKKSFPTEIFHFSNIGETSWSDFATEIFKISNLNCKVHPIKSGQYSGQAKRPLNTTLSKDKITKQFKIRIPTWQESLKEFLDRNRLVVDLW